MGGAVAIRSCGVEKLRCIKKNIDLPLIGLTKSEFPDGTVRITGSFEEAEAVISTGAEIVAVDATFRLRENGLSGPEFIAELKKRHPKMLIMGDISTVEEAVAAAGAGADCVSTTLAGYIHWMLTGEKVLGIGDASGMIPVDSATKTYCADMVEKFDKLVAPKGYGWKLLDIFPKVLVAGEDAGKLTAEGAAKLDVSGNLQAGIPLCPPEGDAGTGMVATNAVKQRTGNVSAGTSSFSMIVLEKALSKAYEPIDMVTTPDGSPVAMVHCNNCTSDINAWVNIFKEFEELMGIPVDMDVLYGKLYNKALEGDADCGGLLAYNYVSGEPITGLAEGRPMFVRSANDKFNLANFMRANLYATIGVLKIGNDILLKEEKVKIDRITGHGGLFKTAGVGQRILAAAINSPISVMETAGEGGAWGIALLASYLVNNAKNENLADFLENTVFAGETGVEIAPTAEDVEGFNKYIATYKAGLAIEQAAVANKQ